VIWGALHGLYLVFALLRDRTLHAAGISIRQNWFTNLLNVFITFVLVDISWVFFRANKLSDAFYILKKITINFTLNEWNVKLVSMLDLVVIIGSILFMETIHILQNKYSMRQLISIQPLWVRWSLYFSWIAIIIIFGEFQERTFIYFQF